jgi:uncharacterized protein YkwD
MKQHHKWAAALIAAISALAPLAPSVSAASDSSSALPLLSVDEWQVVQQTNKERLKNSLPLYAVSFQLQSAANIRKSEIAQLFSHTRPNGDSCFTAIDASDSTASGENIAAGRSTAQETVQQWMNSSGHRENILNPSFSFIGAGYARAEGSQYTHYWVQMFMGRSGSLTGATLKQAANPSGAAIEDKIYIIEAAYSNGSYGYIPVISEMVSGSKADIGAFSVELGGIGNSGEGSGGSGSGEGNSGAQVGKAQLGGAHVSSSAVRLTEQSRSIGAAYYELAMSSSEQGAFSFVSALTESNSFSFEQEGLKTGEYYYFQSTPYSALNGVQGTPSDVLKVRARPLRPASLNASAGKGSATISWQPVSDCDGYAVYRSSSASGPYSLASVVSGRNAAECTVQGLGKGARQYFKLVSYKQAGSAKVPSVFTGAVSVAPY